MTRQSVTFTVPIRTINSKNQRKGTSRWAQSGTTKAQRAAVKLCAFAYRRGSEEVLLPAERARLVPSPWVVRLTRVHPPRHMIDLDDNLPLSLSAVRDAVAEDVLSLPSDRDPRIKFVYEQRHGPDWAVEVEVMGPCRARTVIYDVEPGSAPDAGAAKVHWSSPTIPTPEEHARAELLNGRGIPGSNDDEIAATMLPRRKP